MRVCHGHGSVLLVTSSVGCVWVVGLGQFPMLSVFSGAWMGLLLVGWLGTCVRSWWTGQGLGLPWVPVGEGAEGLLIPPKSRAFWGIVSGVARP